MFIKVKELTSIENETYGSKTIVEANHLIIDLCLLESFPCKI